MLPLTSDIAINPFRCKPQITQGSRLLFHSVLALCYHHLKRLSCNWSDQMSEHRGKAVQLLEGALRSKQSRGNLRLLEPILILFTLDVSGIDSTKIGIGSLYRHVFSVQYLQLGIGTLTWNVPIRCSRPAVVPNL